MFSTQASEARSKLVDDGLCQWTSRGRDEAIYRDSWMGYSFDSSYHSVQRLVRKLRANSRARAVIALFIGHSHFRSWRARISSIWGCRESSEVALGYSGNFASCRLSSRHCRPGRQPETACRQAQSVVARDKLAPRSPTGNCQRPPNILYSRDQATCSIENRQSAPIALFRRPSLGPSYRLASYSGIPNQPMRP
jgi:hypothetical protein